LRIAFAGTPDFAATVLQGILSSAHEVGLVISQPDPRKGRRRKTVRTPVAEFADSQGLPLRQPANISEISDELSPYDALVVAAYGQILRPDTLYATTAGAYNVHASLLPSYRGAAPVERAIMEGETETGVTIMRMDEGLDTGQIALQRPVAIPPEINAGELTDLLADIGAEAIVESLDSLQADALNLVDQDNIHATYASKIMDEDRFIDWGAGVRGVHDMIRALAPHIGARTFLPDIAGPVKIWRSAIRDTEGAGEEIGRIQAENGRITVNCGDGRLEVLELQAPGGRRLAAREFLRGNQLAGTFR
jgi:methionyl-tRNA formyltransferase